MQSKKKREKSRTNIIDPRAGESFKQRNKPKKRSRGEREEEEKTKKRGVKEVAADAERSYSSKVKRDPEWAEEKQKERGQGKNGEKAAR